MTRSVRSSAQPSGARSTPPRPVDVLTDFPELAFLARPAVRLHPRPGSPGLRDSSIGGPLLWPADEAWPVCHAFHGHPSRTAGLRRPGNERVRRRLLTGVYARTGRGEDVALTPSERTALGTLAAPPPESAMGDTPAQRWRARGLPAGPVPLLPVAQLHHRDLPEWPGPEGTDLLQVLWCPFRHDDRGRGPAVSVRWRTAGAVRDVLGRPPEPELMDGTGLLPEPCLLNPERVVEYPYVGQLPAGLYERVGQWEDASGHRYHYDLSLADGWKTGGWACCEPPRCGECGAETRLALTVSSAEWTGTGSWRPVEDALEGEWRQYPPLERPTLVTIGRGHRLHVFVCEDAPVHPCVTAVR